MPNDRQQVERMEAHRSQLLASGRLSVPPGQGRMAIVTMYDHGYWPAYARPSDTLPAMEREAWRIARRLERQGRKVSCHHEAVAGDFWKLLDDPEVSDITVIAMASLSRVHLQPWLRESNPGKPNGTLSFYDAICFGGTRPAITHLKAGAFYQRTCGDMSFAVNPPFAWGFMADRAAIWARPRQLFFPKRDDRPGQGLMPAAQFLAVPPEQVAGPMSYEQAKAAFGAREMLRERLYAVPEFAQPLYDRLASSQRLAELERRARRALARHGI